MTPQITLSQRAEDCIGERVGGDVSIGMSSEPAFIGNLDPAEDQLATLP